MPGSFRYEFAGKIAWPLFRIPPCRFTRWVMTRIIFRIAGLR